MKNLIWYDLQRRTIWCCWTDGKWRFKTFNINLNAQHVNGMTPFDLAVHMYLRLLDTLEYTKSINENWIEKWSWLMCHKVVLVIPNTAPESKLYSMHSIKREPLWIHLIPTSRATPIPNGSWEPNLTFAWASQGSRRMDVSLRSTLKIISLCTIEANLVQSQNLTYYANLFQSLV